METLPPLDAHAHLDPARVSNELADTGAVLAMTLSLDEAALVVDRCEPHITWGVGCHPRQIKPQEASNAERFGELAERAAIAGQQLSLDVKDVRHLAWRNLATVIRETGTGELFPETFATVLAAVSLDVAREFGRPRGKAWTS
jgi:hypothetical protein